MDAQTAAQRWAETWSRAWPQRDPEAIAALYSDRVVYRSPPFRSPALGLTGVRRYLNEQLSAEEDIECWFGRPIVWGDRAAVEWWASWTEQGQELTYAGVTVLRFDDQGQVVEHRDYDNHIDRREAPYSGW
jgi:SnoaL-like domain